MFTHSSFERLTREAKREDPALFELISALLERIRELHRRVSELERLRVSEPAPPTRSRSAEVDVSRSDAVPPDVERRTVVRSSTRASATIGGKR